LRHGLWIDAEPFRGVDDDVFDERRREPFDTGTGREGVQLELGDPERRMTGGLRVQ
jgi:hypothetical protein